jgi:Uma2 family endonuclease
MASSTTHIALKENTDNRTKKRGGYITWETFQKKYLTREDGVKYEWLNGIVGKGEYTIDRTQFYIQENIYDFFHTLKSDGKFSGQIVTEGDLFFLENHRRPDFAYLTKEQIRLSRLGEVTMPLFVIEVISQHDKMNYVYEKLQNYHKAGVQVVWHILPKLQEVHVYVGENMTICRGEKICSAAPVLEVFALAADEIFKIEE